MKFILKENKELSLTVTVEYPLYDSRVESLVRKLKGMDDFITGYENNRAIPIPVSEIYYAESVDGRTFLYTEQGVFGTDKSLKQLEPQLKSHHIIRISRTCLLNIDVLSSMVNLANSKLEATLINGERLIVSRTYLRSIRRLLEEDAE